jgi:predicted ester cyclase
MRWRVVGRHVGHGRYGAPTGQPVEILGITHAEVVGGRILREWVLVDEVALWMQLLACRPAPAASA